SRQRLFSTSDNISDEEIEKVVKQLKSRRYRISEDQGHIMTVKGRFSRWCPYVNHIGLIIILLAALLSQTPLLYLDEYVLLRDGEQSVIPGTNGEYFIESNGFLLETHDADDERFKDALQKSGEPVVKNYQTDLTIYKKPDDAVIGSDELEVVTEDEIRMNHPLKFDSYTL